MLTRLCSFVIPLRIYCSASRVLPPLPMSTAGCEVETFRTISSPSVSCSIFAETSSFFKISSRFCLKSSFVPGASLGTIFTRAGWEPINPKSPDLPSLRTLISTFSRVVFNSLSPFSIASSTLLPLYSLSMSTLLSDKILLFRKCQNIAHEPVEHKARRKLEKHEREKERHPEHALGLRVRSLVFLLQEHNDTHKERKRPDRPAAKER